MEQKKKPKTSTKASPNKKEPVKRKIPAKKDNPDIQNLSKRIKELRIKMGYSNADFFAYENDISRSQYGRYELGEDIRFTTLMKLCRAFKIHPSDFFQDFSIDIFDKKKDRKKL